MSGFQFPRMLTVRQVFEAPPPVDIASTLDAELETTRVLATLRKGSQVGIAVGSRGITGIKDIVRAVINSLRKAGVNPFIIPAMGSHGGATSEGQRELLAEYGITEERLGVPIHDTMEVERIGRTADHVDVFTSVAALRADALVVINRIKPHTDFTGTLGSGVMKMLVVGLGKRVGAANFHVAAIHHGFEHVIRTAARQVLEHVPILCGIGIVENQLHQTARLKVMLPEKLEQQENELFAEASHLMPRVPWDEVDLLIIDRIGKNISGTGMDTNVINRSVHGYSSLLSEGGASKPFMRRIFVRELTPETHGNAIGIGLADVTTNRLVRGIDERVMFINSLTSMTPNASKVPMHFESDREAIERMLLTLAGKPSENARVVRIHDTLSLEHLEVSEACFNERPAVGSIVKLSEPASMDFDPAGNLATALA